MTAFTIAWVAGGLGKDHALRSDAALPSWSASDQVDTADGEYAIEGLPPALVTFRVEAKGCQPLDRTLDLARSSGAQRNSWRAAAQRAVAAGGAARMCSKRASSVARRVNRAAP